VIEFVKLVREFRLISDRTNTIQVEHGAIKHKIVDMYLPHFLKRKLKNITQSHPTTAGAENFLHPRKKISLCQPATILSEISRNFVKFREISMFNEILNEISRNLVN